MRGALGSATVVLIHADRPAPGFVEVNTVEFATATQNDGDGHDTAWRVNGPFTPARLQALAPPVGLVEVSTFPESSTAAHIEVVGHATPLRPLKPGRASIRVNFQAERPVVGFLDVSTSPAVSTATQNDVVGQETPDNPGRPPPG
jgi:hypothetical protein